MDISTFHCPYLIPPKKKTDKEPEILPLGKGETSNQTTNFWVPAVHFPEVYTWQELILQIRLQASMREMKNHHIHSIS